MLNKAIAFTAPGKEVINTFTFSQDQCPSGDWHGVPGVEYGYAHNVPVPAVRQYVGRAQTGLLPAPYTMASVPVAFLAGPECPFASGPSVVQTSFLPLSYPGEATGMEALVSGADRMSVCTRLRRGVSFIPPLHPFPRHSSITSLPLSYPREGAGG